MYDQSFLVRAA